MPQTIDPATLAQRVRARRTGRRQSVREAADDVGVSPATFSRVERGDYVPGRENLLRFAAWLGIPIQDLVADGVLPTEASPPESTPEAVAVHLRADKNLSPEDAEVLQEVFRSAYQALVKRKQPRSSE